MNFGAAVFPFGSDTGGSGDDACRGAIRDARAAQP
jgi:hypothetical protein